MSMFIATAVRETARNFVSTTVPASAETAISSVFQDPERPRFTRVGSARYTSDGLDAPVNRPEGFRTGNYVTFRTYDRPSNPNGVVHYNVSGTGPNGEYIPPHQVDDRGRVTQHTGAPYQFRIHEQNKMIALLDLRSGGTDERGRTFYTREGFGGRYYLQTENDGQVSVHYSGGTHVSGRPLPPQTFVNGSWDLSRREPVGSPGSLALPSTIVSRPHFVRGWRTT